METFVIDSDGSPEPLGATCLSSSSENGSSYLWNFALFSTNRVKHLVVQDIQRANKPVLIPLNDTLNRSGDIWHICIKSSEKQFFWCWSDAKGYIQDPYAKLLDSGNAWGGNRWQELKHGHPIPMGTTYDWNSLYRNRPNSQENDPLIIYEMHIRGFTKDPSSKVLAPGTFLGAIEKLDYLRKLGITAIELLPIAEFDESEFKLGEKTIFPCNYWGYSPLNFFSPHGRYFSSPNPLDWPQELASFVHACHETGIKVLLDVVFNHTGEGNSEGPRYSWKAAANRTYYILNEADQYVNYSGCGNTVNANNPITARMIIDALRHWVLAYGIDGFRFDLASALTRNQSGSPMSEPLLLEMIGQDPILSHAILIMEPWDAAGLYQTGQLFHLNQKKEPLFLEWNDKFRDDARRFIKGAPGLSGQFATRMCGSQDLYNASLSPNTSINYITAHDGFSLYDLVSYNTKHNMANGEHNRDGAFENYSWNCGHEGETDASSIRDLRIRQMQNHLTALLLAQGVPMLLMGDEYGHTKDGNNNAWCHDGPINWFSWKQAHENSCLIPFIKNLIEFRIKSGLFYRKQFLDRTDVEWHGRVPYEPDWGAESTLIAFSLIDSTGAPATYHLFYSGPHDIHVEIPKPAEGFIWCVLVNTGLPRPENFSKYETAPVLTRLHLTIRHHSCLILFARLMNK